LPYPAFTRALDLEHEVAIVIGKDGRNIKAADAHEYIAGFMILNDWSARDIQRTEMAVGLGPAKAKDFATSVGPWLVTPDELADRLQPDGRYDLATLWKLNGREMFRNNFKTQHYTFAQCIERASQNVWLRRGDVIGSGTVGNGCLLEQGDRERFLQVGDTVTLEVERLGVLQTRIVEA
jgi:fumarylacetoacetate (FAA) hydrolase